MERRDSFVVYRSYLNSINQLPKAKRWDALMAIAAYAMDHEEPDMDKLGVAGTVFYVAQPLLDKNNRKHELAIEREARKREAKAQTDHNPTTNEHRQTTNEHKQGTNVNVNVNENAYVVDPLKGSTTISRACEAPDGGAPATAAPPSADEIQELKNKLRAKGAIG